MTLINSCITPLSNFYAKLSPRCFNLMHYSSFHSLYKPTDILSTSLNKCNLYFAHKAHLHSTFQQSHISLSKLLDSPVKNVFYQMERGYAMRLELTEYGITWRRPEEIPSWKPEKSGDLVPFDEPDKTKPIVSLLSIENEIANSDKRVQDLFSLEFHNAVEVVKFAKLKLKRRIQRHQFDEDSLEVKIAMMTVDIRYLQKFLSEVKSLKRFKRKRIKLQETVAKRKKMLKILRRFDYKRFEWLIEELGIIYKPFPRVLDRPSRREGLRRLVALHCAHLKDTKMEQYKQHLETLKKPFLEEKRETLKWIAETEKKVGVPVSVEVPEDGKQNGQPLQLECSSENKENVS